MFTLTIDMLSKDRMAANRSVKKAKDVRMSQ